MKKNLQIGKKIALALMLLVTASVVNAQRTASASGAWSDPLTWGGSSVPTSSDAVTINSGITVTVDVTANCASITFPTGNTANSSVNVNSGITLNVVGAITIPRAGTAGPTNFVNTLAVGAGTVNAGSVSFTSGGTTVRHQITISTGTLDVSGAISGTNNNTSGTITMSGAGTIRVGGGMFDNGDGTLTATAGTFEYDGSSAQTIQGFSYFNLNLSGGGAKSLAASTTITGDLSIASGTTLALGANNFTLSANANKSVSISGTLEINGTGDLLESNGGTKTVTLNSGGRILLSSTNATFPVLNAYSINSASIIEYSAGGNQTIENGTSAPTFTYGNLVTSGTGTKTLEAAGGAMTFNGGITIGNGTTLASNNKTINVAGSFTNNGTFTQGTSSVVLNGAAAQVVGGTTATTFNNLTVNNTSTGVSVTRDITVSGTFTLTDGVVTTAATPAGLVTLAAGASLSGGSLASHVNGPLARTGNTNFTFPVGNGTLYRPIGFSSMSGGAPGTVVTARYFLANPRTTFGTTGTGPALPIKDVSLCEYWDLNDGAATTTAIVSLQYSSTSPCNGGGYIGDPASLLVAHWNNTTSTWENMGAAPGATGTNMTAATASSFSPFTIGTSDAGLNGLPVSFTDVKAFEKGNGVQIDFTNSTESDLSEYVIERSANGVDFTAIGQLAPRSNQFDKVSYTYIDAAPLAGTNFYRVKAVELTGKNVYSKSLRVDIGRSPKGISLYPNPVRGSEITIGFSAQKGQYNLNVVNTAGQVVYRQTLNHAGGTVAQTVSLPAALKAGVYNVLISGDNYKETKTFVIQ